jgi:transposase
MARDRAALAEAPRNGPAARLADARDRQRHLLCHAGGCPWRLLPNDFPPWGTIYRWFAARRVFPFIQRVFADSGYAGEKIAKATLIAVEIVRKNPDQIGFAVNPRRWVVERFFAWIGRNRRLAKDFESTIDSARAFLNAASVMLLVRRIARAS